MKSSLCWLAIVVFTLFGACSGSAARTVVFHGVTVTTSLPHGVALIGERIDASGARHLLGYAMLGRLGGHVTIGSALASTEQIRLQIGVGADLWRDEGAGEKLLESASVTGLSGANADHGTITFKGAIADTSCEVSAATSIEVGLEKGVINLCMNTPK